MNISIKILNKRFFFCHERPPLLLETPRQGYNNSTMGVFVKQVFEERRIGQLPAAAAHILEFFLLVRIKAL